MKLLFGFRLLSPWRALRLTVGGALLASYLLWTYTTAACVAWTLPHWTPRAVVMQMEMRCGS